MAHLAGLIAGMFRGRSHTVNLRPLLRLTRNLPALVGWWLAPPRCTLCDAPGMLPRLDLCAACHATLPRDTDPWRAGPPSVTGVLAPWQYGYPVDAMIRGLKFHGECSFARLFGELLARERRALGSELPDLLMPLPLHARRHAERGYNQAAELARHAGRQLDRRVCCRRLLRPRVTRPQSSLSAAARRANVRNAFRVTGDVCGLRVALVDDVITTGSTAGAAAGALLQAGAAEVELWVVARVGRRDGKSQA